MKITIADKSDKDLRRLKSEKQENNQKVKSAVKMASLWVSDFYGTFSNNLTLNVFRFPKHLAILTGMSIWVHEANIWRYVSWPFQVPICSLDFEIVTGIKSQHVLELDL